MQLLAPGMQPVAFTASHLAGGGVIRGDMLEFMVLTPAQPLQPNTAYTVVRGDGSTLEFTVGDAADTEPPRVPVIRRRAYRADFPIDAPFCGSCDAQAEFSVDFDGMLLVGVVNNDPAFDAASMSGGAEVLSAGPSVAAADHVACGDAEESVIRFAAVDMAGNLSPFTEPAYTEPQSCKNALALPAGWSALLGLVLLRRRARHMDVKSTAR